jgi:hypothetical protein
MVRGTGDKEVRSTETTSVSKEGQHSIVYWVTLKSGSTGLDCTGVIIYANITASPKMSRPNLRRHMYLTFQ